MRGSPGATWAVGLLGPSAGPGGSWERKKVVSRGGGSWHCPVQARVGAAQPSPHRCHWVCKANPTPGPALGGTHLLPQCPYSQLQQREQFPNVPKLVPPHPSSHTSWQPNPISPLPSLESWKSPRAEALTIKSSGTASAGGSGGAMGGGRPGGCSHGFICSAWHRSIPTSAWSWASSSVCRWAAREPGRQDLVTVGFTAAISPAPHQARVQGHCGPGLSLLAAESPPRAAAPLPLPIFPRAMSSSGL